MTRMTLITTMTLMAVLLMGFAEGKEGERLTEIETNVLLGMPLGWVDLGPAPTSSSFQVYIALSQTNLPLLHEFISKVSKPKSPSYGQYKSIKEINEMVAPSPITKEKVQYWLDQNNLSYKYLSPDWMEVNGSVEKINRLLSIQLRVFQHISSKTIVYRSLNHYQIPSHLSSSIDFISNTIRFPSLRGEQKAVADFYVTPESIQSLYNITIPSPNDNLQAVASFLEQYYSSTDLQSFQTMFSLPEVPIEETFGYNNDDDPGVEASLDVQYLYGITNCSVRTWVYSTNGTTPSQNEPFLQWLLSLPSFSSIPNLISMSYQDYEYTVSSEYAIRVCNEFAKYTATGVTFITGSGDWGVGCFSTYSCSNFTADFPSSCPYVISTGATTLRDESAVEEGVAFSSGGFSNYFSLQDYQTNVVNQFLSSSNNLPPTSFFNRSGRAFPDVSAIGTNFAVIVGGTKIPVGGTSAATPTFGSVLSMINTLRLSNNLPTLGFALPFLYEAYSSSPSSFQDITEGEEQDQGCCGYSFTAEEGWDPYTGLGTPNSFVLSQLALDSSFFHFPSSKQ